MATATHGREVVQHEVILNRKAEMHRKRHYWNVRRIQDIVFSLFAIVLLLPVFAVTALAVYLDDPHAAPIFKQTRVGRNGKDFTMYKFRSMYADAEERLAELMKFNEMDGPAFKIKKDPRITRVGHFIRKVSIDELPQLFNVLKGDMSIVGPRPALPREVEQYTDYQRQRLYITPGLTCIWQVQPDRNSISFEDWMRMDIQYIRERSFLLDWKLIFQTFLAVFRAQGE